MEIPIYKQFHELEKTHWWFKGMYGLCRDMLRRYIRGGKDKRNFKILDVGCGTGFWSESLLNYGDVVALDSISEAINICRNRQFKHLIQADAERLPVHDQSYDIITAIGLIEHLDNDRDFLKEAKRALKPGGYGLMLTSAYMFLWSEHDVANHHRRRYTASLLRGMIEEAGLELVKISYVNTILFPPVLLVRLVSRLFRRKGGAKNTHLKDLFTLPGFLNELLYGVLKVESWLLRWVGLPFGVSIVVVVHKRDNV